MLISNLDCKEGLQERVGINGEWVARLSLSEKVKIRLGS